MYLFELKPTSKCKGNCWFCSDRINICKDAPIDLWIKQFKKVREELRKNKLIEEYFISGGEPTYNPTRLERVLKVLFEEKNIKVGIATNAYRLKECLSLFKKYPVSFVSISRHNVQDGGIKNTPTNNELKNIVNRLSKHMNVSLSCVLQKDTNIDAILTHAKDLNFTGVNFLQLSGTLVAKILPIENIIKKLDSRKIAYMKRNSYFCHCAVYNLDNMHIRIKHASIPRINKAKLDVINQFTLHPDGSLTSGWLRNKRIILPAIRRCDEN